MTSSDLLGAMGYRVGSRMAWLVFAKAALATVDIKG